jgi:hypothetical protein
MITHITSSSVSSPFNPMVALKPHVRLAINEHFIKPILHLFFSDKIGANGMKGIENFEAFNIEKIKTEIEFQEEDDFVKNYIYKEIVSDIKKGTNGRIAFKPRYTISFDWDLTFYKMDGSKAYPKNYPYKKIFNDPDKEEKQIRYGTLRIGETPVLYIVFIDFQEVLRFSRKLRLPELIVENKIFESVEERRLRLFEDLIRKKERQLRASEDSHEVETIQNDITRLNNLRKEPLQGSQGKLRVNLAWNTTDDLDLHVETPNGEIFYGNKAVECGGVVGVLDVDRNSSNELVSNPQENISWESIPDGIYKVKVHLFKSREKIRVPFTITILNTEGDGHMYNSYVDEMTQTTMNVASFQFKDGILIFDDLTAIAKSVS